MHLSMGCFLGGLVFCGLALVASYLTQLRLYAGSVGRADNSFTSYAFWLYLAMFLCLFSIVAFAAGSYFAVLRF